MLRRVVRIVLALALGTVLTTVVMVARGVGGTTNLVCDGIEQVGSVQIPVAANRDETFRVGVGLVMATFSACDATTSCTDFGISKTVQITKAPSLAKG